VHFEPFLSPLALFYVTPSPLFCHPEPSFLSPRALFYVTPSPLFCHPEPSFLSPRALFFVTPSGSEGSLGAYAPRDDIPGCRPERSERGRRPERSEGCTACARQDKKWALGRTR
jgi:hypothetical protein